METTEYVQGLRALADFYEQNPEAARVQTAYVRLNDREKFLRMVKLMAKGGRVDKSAGSSANMEGDYTAIRMFGPLRFLVSIPRKLVCRLVSPAVYDCPDSLLEAGKEYETEVEA